MRIQHRSFRFSKPDLIDENQYSILKNEFINNPSLSIIPKTSFWQTFSEDIKNCIFYPLLIVIITLVIFKLTGWEFLGIIVFLAGFYFAFHFFLRIAFDMLSYLSFYIDITSYYKNLKRRIINSNDYEDMKKRYWFWVNQHQ